MKLKYREIAEYRQAQLEQQEHRCALCGEHIEDSAVLDHDHKTGLLRRVLHRGCNSLLGKIENSLPRSQVSMSRLKGIAQNLISYLETQHTGILHPTYKSKEERKMGMGRGRGRGKKPPKR